MLISIVVVAHIALSLLFTTLNKNLLPQYDKFVDSKFIIFNYSNGDRSMLVWQELLEQTQVLGEEGLQTVSELEISSFENSHRVKLPEDYKDFCKVFGTGTFGATLSLYCLPYDQTDVGDLKRELEDNKDLEGSELSYRLRDGESLPVNEISRILNYAFVFGHTSGGEIVIFDLQSYSATDNSCDIYMTRVEDFPGIYKVGRNLLEFIQLFGWGIGDFSLFPEWTHPDPNELERSFTPFQYFP